MEPRDFNFRRWFVTVFFIVLAAAAYVIGYRVTEIDPVKLFTSLPKSQKILSALIRPDLFTREAEDTTIDIVFPVPCDWRMFRLRRRILGLLWMCHVPVPRTRLPFMEQVCQPTQM